MRKAFLTLAILTVVLTGCGGSESEPQSACEERYDQGVEDGVNFVTTKEEWVANCEGRPTPVDPSPTGDPVPLGQPVLASIAPAVVPEGAQRGCPDSNEECYTLPSGTTSGDLKAWYAEHMPPGEPFDGLTWVDQDVILDPSTTYWFWCAPNGLLLTISIYDYDPEAIQVAVSNDEDPADEC